MQESFSMSAGRHLQDAQILLTEHRWDNAVYLSGYVVECSFKVLIEQYFSQPNFSQPSRDGREAKKFGHDLTKLEGKAMERLRTMYPVLDRQLPSSRIDGTVLANDHPERRYAASNLWTAEQATVSVERASKIYMSIIPKLVLDGLIRSQDI
jgi:HEPN domain-containing protein